jgi:Fe(3+) dicitrate transport protein
MLAALLPFFSIRWFSPSTPECRPHRRADACRSSVLRLGACCAAILMAGGATFPQVARAQGAPASLTGQVLDSSGGGIPHATITLRLPQAGFEETTTADGEGRYEFRGVPPAAYEISARADGFSVAARRVDVSARELRVNITLVPGDLVEQVTVFGTQIAASPEVAARIPGSVDTIDAATIAASHPFNFGEALRKAPGVHVREEEGLGLRPSIGLRGLDPNRSAKVLLLEDGVPLGHAPYGDTDAYYHPPLERYESIEVLKGSSQIAYGPMTIGGVINYITPPTPDRPMATLNLAGGNLSFLNAHASAGTRVGRLGLRGDLLRKQGDGSRENMATRVTDANVKASLMLAPTQVLTVKGNLYDESSSLTYSGLTQPEFLADPRGNPFVNDRFYGDRRGIAATYTNALHGNVLLSARMYGSSFSRDWWRQSSNSDQRPNDRTDPNCGGMQNLSTTCGNEGRLRHYEVWGAEAQVRFTYSLVGLRSETDLGVRGHWESQDRLQKNGDLPLSRDGVLVESNARHNEAYSGYAQQRVLFGRWTVTPGVRVEHVQIERTNRLATPAASGETSLVKAVPGIGASFNPAERVTLFAGAHRGFAPPRPADIITNTGGVLELEPELSWNYEIGMRSMPGAGLRVDATAFRMAYENQIVPASLSGGVGATLTSAGETLHQGFEIAVRSDLGTLRRSAHNPFVRVAYTNVATAEYRGTRFSHVSGFHGISIRGNRLPYAPRHLLNLNVGYVHPKGVDGLLEAVYAGDQFSDDLNTVEPTPNGQRGLIPAYALWNAAVNYRPAAFRRITTFVAVKNLFDRTEVVDRRRGIQVTMPRQVHVGARLAF